MLLGEVFRGKTVKIHPILRECSDFIKESDRLPVLKNLSVRFDDIQKLKLRQRKKKDKFTQTFNEAFNKTPNLKQRSISTNGESSFITDSLDNEPFYIFPINGYRYLYSLEVSNSKEDYQEIFENIIHLMKDKSVMKDILKYTYVDIELKEGIEYGSEIIFYHIPYCYIARKSTISNYQEFLLSLEKP